MQYPTKKQVKEADRLQICNWYRHLPSPDNPVDEKVMNLIIKRFEELGGWSPEISKAVGWN